MWYQWALTGLNPKGVVQVLPNQLLTLAIGPAMTLLPERMDSLAARRMLVAMAVQESDLLYRRQIRGPARGLWQFEMRGGTAGVLNHGSTSAYARRACNDLLYDADDLLAIFTALEHNDVLAAVFARLLLWTLPQPLPEDRSEGWSQYLAAWRPGRPHEVRWLDSWAISTEAVA